MIMDFKVKCVSSNFTPHFTVGNIYEVTDEGLKTNEGSYYTLWMRGKGVNNFEKLSKWFVNNDPGIKFAKINAKIVITTDGETTTATKYCEDGKKVTTTAKCSPEDTFDFDVGAKLAMERLMDAVTPPKRYNGKIVCIKNPTKNHHQYTLGKIYEVVDGRFPNDNGELRPKLGGSAGGYIKEFKEINEWSASEWLEIKE